MSEKNDRKRRQDVKKQFARDNQTVFQGFMLEISAQPFRQRFMFCMRMAFKRHNLQKGMKDQIAARRLLLKAERVAAGVGEGRWVEVACGATFIIVLTGLIAFVGR